VIKKIIFGVVIILILGAVGYWLWYRFGVNIYNPKGENKEVEVKKLEKYDFDELKKRQGVASEIKMLGDAKDVEKRRLLYKSEKINSRGELQFARTKIFSFTSNNKTITGMINEPVGAQSIALVPAIIMIRGFAESAGYYTGSGTWKAADKLAEAGYMTVSIDFLGFGGSDKESPDILEARFEKVMSVIDLIESVKKLPYVDQNRIGIWAHSNGGQIALSVLEVTGGNYPTVLWSPMTQKFPESVLSTIDEGSPVKAVIEEFQKHYDARRYAFENYYNWIKAPIVIHQGTADEWCKVEWQKDLQSRLKSLGKEATLYIYPGDNHNLSKNWDEVVARDVEFYNGKLKIEYGE